MDAEPEILPRPRGDRGAPLVHTHRTHWSSSSVGKQRKASSQPDTAFVLHAVDAVSSASEEQGAGLGHRASGFSEGSLSLV